jgi:hypothetical protein
MVAAGGAAGLGTRVPAAPFPAVLPLASLLPGAGGDGSTGFVLTGIDGYDGSGRSVSAAGDVNGDGIGDLIVGALRADPDGRSAAGESYVVFGRDTAQAGDFPAVFELSSLQPQNGGDGSAGFVLNGIDVDDQSGVSVSAAGDVNGDGIGDLVIGAFRAAPGFRAWAGESYVVFGRDTERTGHFPAAFELSSLLPRNGGDGSAGFVLKGIDAYDESGLSVSGAGDVNGDGIDDLIVGARGADPGDRHDAGESYVVFGRDTARAGSFPAVYPLASLLPGGGGDGSAGFVLSGIDAGDFSGISVSAAGDVDGDGIGDLIVGASGGDPGGTNASGESYVVFGRDSATVGNFPARYPLASLLPAAGGDGSAGIVLLGIDALDFSGFPVSTAGDLNGDGIGDLVVGAYRADPDGRCDAGETYVVFGRSAAPAQGPSAQLP